MLSYEKFHLIVSNSKYRREKKGIFFFFTFFDTFRHQLLNETIAYFVSHHQINTAFGAHHIQFCHSLILLNGVQYTTYYLHMPRIKCLCRTLKIRIFSHLFVCSHQNEIDPLYCNYSLETDTLE